MTDLNTRITSYLPSDETIKAIKKITLVMVIGPACVGKTTLINAAVKQDDDICLVLSDTDRLARPEEKNGVDYYFRTRAEMLDLLDSRAFVQIAPIVSGDLYASQPASYGSKGSIAMMAVWADAVSQFRQLPFRSLRSIFITPPSFKEWQNRLRKREFSTEQRFKRLVEARRSFEFALSDSQLQFIINDNLTLAEADFLQLVHGKMSVKLANDQIKAREIINDVIRQLE